MKFGYHISMPFYANTEQANVDEMWYKYYNESFKKSHRVLLVSHSQGNLFANRINDTIAPTEYQNYFANLQVASPASEIKAIKGNYVTLDGDKIVGYIPHRMTPNANLDNDESKELSNHMFVESYLSHEDSLNQIIEKLELLLSSFDSELSQWMTKDEISEIGEKEYRITVKHRFDNAVVDIDDEVYPFDASKYLYQVPDSDGVFHYVKASFGGEKILDAELDVNEWEAEDNQFYKLKGTGEIIGFNCNLEIVGSANPKIHADYGLWLNPSSGNYIKYPFKGEKLTHFKCKLTGFYNTPEAGGSIGLYIKYLDGSTHNLTYIFDWRYPNQGQVISVNGSFIEGSYNTYYRFGRYWNQGPMKDFINYQIDADVPIDKQDYIDYIYIYAGRTSHYGYNNQYIKDIELTIDEKVIILNPSCLRTKALPTR